MISGMETNTIIIICLAFLCLSSLITFVLFGVDKRRAVSHQWRISEGELLLSSIFGGIGGLLGMALFRHKTKKWKFRILIPLFAAADAMIAAFLLWASVYYHAGTAALAAMQSDNAVAVETEENGWLFDGPSEEGILIFYPGAKVEEEAYAPLLHQLAEKEMDVYLVKMPFHLAIFGINAAEKVSESMRYDRFYVGGHSLGGAMAAKYAAGHEDSISGMILFAAYPPDKTTVDTLMIYGSEDGVLNMARVEESEELVSGKYSVTVINGGNHAQFGDYGEQSGDSIPRISADEQRRQSAEAVKEFLR